MIQRGIEVTREAIEPMLMQWKVLKMSIAILGQENMSVESEGEISESLQSNPVFVMELVKNMRVNLVQKPNGTDDDDSIASSQAWGYKPWLRTDIQGRCISWMELDVCLRTNDTVCALLVMNHLHSYFSPSHKSNVAITKAEISCNPVCHELPNISYFRPSQQHYDCDNWNWISIEQWRNRVRSFSNEPDGQQVFGEGFLAIAITESSTGNNHYNHIMSGRLEHKAIITIPNFYGLGCG